MLEWIAIYQNQVCNLSFFNGANSVLCSYRLSSIYCCHLENIGVANASEFQGSNFIHHRVPEITHEEWHIRSENELHACRIQFCRIGNGLLVPVLHFFKGLWLFCHQSDSARQFQHPYCEIKIFPETSGYIGNEVGVIDQNLRIIEHIHHVIGGCRKSWAYSDSSSLDFGDHFIRELSRHTDEMLNSIHTSPNSSPVTFLAEGVSSNLQTMLVGNPNDFTHPFFR